MARHGRHRHAPLRFRSRDDARPVGVRQLIRTPTFALGLSVVAAAVLAFGTTQTYLRFSGSGPEGGCGVTGCADPAASPTPPSVPDAGHARPAAVQVTYATLGSGRQGFTGELVITNRTRREITDWRLAISYSGSRITRLTGADWLPQPNRASGTLTPAATAGPLAAGEPVRIVYTATGTARPPSGCDFDGVGCRIRSSPGT